MKGARAILHWVFGDYALYRIYALSLDRILPVDRGEASMREIDDVAELSVSSAEEIRSLTEYAGTRAYCFGAWVGADLACACWYWAGETYARRNFWPLSEDEAKLIQITTAERYRGRGLAPALLSFSAERMRARGYRRLFARIWHSHEASRAAFRKAGWRYVAFVAELQLFSRRNSIRWVRRVA